MIELMCRHWYDAEKRQTDVNYDKLTQARRDEGWGLVVALEGARTRDVA